MCWAICISIPNMQKQLLSLQNFFQLIPKMTIISVLMDTGMFKNNICKFRYTSYSKNAMTFSLRKNLKFLWPCICVGNFFVTKHLLHAKWLFKEKWGVIKKSHNITIIFLHNSQGWLDIKHEWKRCCDSKPCPCLRLLPHF